MARAFGSYPECHRFKSSRRYHLRLTPLLQGLIQLKNRRAKHEDEYNIVLHRMQEPQLQDEQKQKEYSRPYRNEEVLQILQEAHAS